MKIICSFLLSLFVSSSVFAQDIEKRYFENNPTLGGDVVIKSASVQVIGDETSKTFEIESVEDGAYYLDAWIMVPDDFSEYKVKVKGCMSYKFLSESRLCRIKYKSQIKLN
jgi:hypothetical protein